MLLRRARSNIIIKNTSLNAESAAFLRIFNCISADPLAEPQAITRGRVISALSNWNCKIPIPKPEKAAAVKFYGQYASDNNLLDSLLGNSISQFWRNGWEMYEDTHVDIDNYLSEKLFLYMDYATQGRINIRNLFNYAKAHAD